MNASLNLKYYTGKDHYSEGAIEDELLDIVKRTTDFESVLRKDQRWSILYHLSPIRQNIINWFPFNSNGSVLEIGGGCGAITSALCKNISQVKVVELSKKRSLINLERNKQFDNLEIIVGNLNDIKFPHRFDYVTLIGVLEYASSFTYTNNAHKDFLLKIKQLLKPEGKLLIAIENRFGMKYFSGAKEDHTGKEFDGITGYVGNASVKTFGLVEIKQLLLDCGFTQTQFYYPHPDYKMPMEIFSDDFLPTSDSFLPVSPNFDSEKVELYNESLAFRGVIENQNYPFFANSFFIECGI